MPDIDSDRDRLSLPPVPLKLLSGGGTQLLITPSDSIIIVTHVSEFVQVIGSQDAARDGDHYATTEPG